MQNLLTPDIVNQMFMLSGVLVTLKIILFVWLGNVFLTLFISLGNYLKHTRPNSWFRKIFWASCDSDGGCRLCSIIEVVEIYKVKIK